MKKVVTIGGGTGSFTLLSGLRKYPIEISAIVSMADDGGSTGVLRDELGVLPPGDVRQCLVALSNSRQAMRELMGYRFEEGGLAGHSFGNLLLSALEKTQGSFLEGVEEAAKILNISGAVIPVTGDDVSLHAKLVSGEVLVGEHDINTHEELRKNGIERLFLDPVAHANPKAVEAILDADMVVIGPGNHFCSILPNLLVRGVPEALQKTSAKIVYNCNLINKKGHTDAYTLADYVCEVNQYIGGECIDVALVNSVVPAEELLVEYQKEGDLVALGDDVATEVYARDLLSNGVHRQKRGDTLIKRSYIRHDSEKLAKALMEILEDNKSNQQTHGISYNKA